MALSDFIRCGSCQNSEWHDGFRKLWCQSKEKYVDPVHDGVNAICHSVNNWMDGEPDSARQKDNA